MKTRACVCGRTNLGWCFQSGFVRTSPGQSALVRDGSRERGEPHAAPHQGTSSLWPAGTHTVCLLDDLRRTSSWHIQTHNPFINFPVEIQGLIFMNISIKLSKHRFIIVFLVCVRVCVWDRTQIQRRSWGSCVDSTASKRNGCRWIGGRSAVP